MINEDKGVTMQTIHIDVKDNYVSNVLTMLKSMKDIMIDNIHVDSVLPKDDEHTFMDLQVSSMQKTWDNDTDKAWDAL